VYRVWKETGKKGGCREDHQHHHLTSRKEVGVVIDIESGKRLRRRVDVEKTTNTTT
jgi:hypothetical protein